MSGMERATPRGRPYRAGRENNNANALSHSPHLPAPAVGTAENKSKCQLLLQTTSQRTVLPKRVNQCQTQWLSANRDNQKRLHCSLNYPSPQWKRTTLDPSRRIQLEQHSLVHRHVVLQRSLDQRYSSHFNSAPPVIVRRQ